MRQIKNNGGQEIVEANQDELTFRGQRSDEQVILLLRQHPFVLCKAGFIVTVMLSGLATAFSIFGVSAILSLVIFIVVPLALYIGFSAWYLWVNTIFVLTNQRIIAVYQPRWFSRNVTETELENIVSIEHTVEGAVKSFLNFGEINIRSSGAVENEVLLKNVYDPYGVQQKVLDYAKKTESR